MTSAHREKWLGTLEIIAIRRPDEAEAEWAWVMKELGLGPDYFLAVLEAVRQGRWREGAGPGKLSQGGGEARGAGKTSHPFRS